MSSEPIAVALVQLCVDDRLDHAKIRMQIAEKLRDIYLKADRIFLLNEVGGNLGQNLRNTLEVFLGAGAQVSFCAVLHHDECVAAQAGYRLPMEQTVAELSGYLAARRVSCPVYTGFIRTRDNLVEWGSGQGQQLPEAA